MMHVFVYGTLKRGYPNHHAIAEHVKFVGRFRTAEAFPLVVGGRWFSPYLINEPGLGQEVVGEVFKVSARGLALFDQLEGAHLPKGYYRISATVMELQSGRHLDAWTYVKERQDIDGIVSDPMDEYQLDSRYVPPSQRTSIF